MKIALHHSAEVGFRAGQIILGDRRVELVGVVDRTPSDSRGGRVVRVDDLSGYDVLVTDDRDPLPYLRRALDAGVPCAIWVEPDPTSIEPGGLTVLVGANLASGIAPCLASHEVARLGKDSTAVVAWTEPGSPLRSGEPLAFPDPVGGRWGRRVQRGDDSLFVAPIDGEWAGALARVTAPGPDGPTRIVGVSDLAPHLEALALAAGTLAVASGAYPPGVAAPVDAAEAYLAEALGAGLDVAAYTLQPG